MPRAYINLVFLITIAALTSVFLYLHFKPQSLWAPQIFDFRRINEPVILDLPPIQKVCSEPEQIPNVFILFEYRMGAFNAINRLQVCIRWAMDAGIGLVTPIFITRNGTASVNLDGINAAFGLDFFFDGEFILQALHHNCPHLTIANLTEIGPHNTIHMRHVLYDTTHNKPGKFRKFVRKLLAKASRDSNFDPLLPTIIRETYEPLINWKISSDPVAFQFAFHNLFKFSPSLMEISNQILANLPYLYIGVHLRMEEDWGYNRRTVEEFVEKVLEKVDYAMTRTVYVACGDLSQHQAFKNASAPYGLHVVNKWDFVTTEEKERMENELFFDQLGIVDYEVLFHSSYFLGTARSSYSSSLGLRRHIAQYGDFVYGETDVQQDMIGKSIMFYNHLW